MLVIFFIFILMVVMAASVFYFYSPDTIEQIKSLIQEDKYETAIMLLKKEIIKKPNNAETYFLLADCYLYYQNYEEALNQYNTIKNRKMVHDQKSKVALLYNIADACYSLGQYENVFSTCLEILQMLPDDLKATKIIAFMLLGKAKFELAFPYLEKLMILEPNPKNENAYAITLYETGKTEKSMKLMKKQIDNNPSDSNLSILYLSMCAFHGRKEGINYLQEIFPTIKDETIVIFLVRLYCYMIYNVKLHPKVLEFLRKQIHDPKFHVEVKRECTYFLIFFLLQLRNAGEAEHWINTFEKSYGNYRHLKDIKVSIGLDVSDTGEILDFETLYKKEFESLFSEELVYKLSGLNKDYPIDLDRFFQVPEDKRIVLNPGYQRKSMDSLLDVYYHLTKDGFLKFTEKACKWLHLRIVNMTKNLDEQSIDYLCEDEKTDEKLVMSFKQFKKNANVSDIFLNNLLTNLHKYETDKVILVTNGELTEAAQKKLKSTESIEVLQGAELHNLLQETLGGAL